MVILVNLYDIYIIVLLLRAVREMDCVWSLSGWL